MNKRFLKTGVALKALDDAGHGLVRIATMSAIDHDRDTYAPGAFGEQWAQILGAHQRAMVPIGKARVYERGDEALAELHMNLATAAGKDWHAALKFDLEPCCEGSRPIQEWSYGFEILDSVMETRDGKTVRVLKRLDVHEVSPVVRGAGIGTATLAMKAGRPFAEQLDAAIAELADIAERAQEVGSLRAAEGRPFSKERLDQLAALQAGLAEVIAAGRPDDGAAGKLLAQFEAFKSRRHRGG